MDKKTIASFVVVTLCVFAAFLLTLNSLRIHRPANINVVTIGNVQVAVDTAISPEAHAKGLSFRPSLGENEGMLFIFKIPGKYQFWMKDMNFPIDMIWINTELRVVYIKKDARPELYPETYGPRENDEDAKYVLEVPSGFTDKHNVKVGDSVFFTY